MKYTPDILEKIRLALEDGMGRVMMCKKVAIDYQTFLNWMKDKIEFVELVKKAEEKGHFTNEEFYVSCIRNKAKDQWQAAAWMLERTMPNKYAKREESFKSTEKRHIINFKIRND